MKIADLNICKEISKECFGAVDNILMEYVGESTTQIYVAKENEKIIGVGELLLQTQLDIDSKLKIFIKDKLFMNIQMLAVSQLYRGKGVGNKLTEFFCNISNSANIPIIMEVMNYAGKTPAKTKDIADSFGFEYMGYIPNRWKNSINNKEYCIYCKGYDCDCGSIIFRKQ